ncbi:hypothetical protein EC973_009636 [Apophysomyces ossiformis]|uniref:alpha-1,2-Mannosidase n=1 Tax=Apophysomyces ossiformis TaxID=679940 RepID=A0A8H7BVC9_9FUNG|nr:hypothetical protein EC973_009636 [Apophysomyces ossiformis]
MAASMSLRLFILVCSTTTLVASLPHPRSGLQGCVSSNKRSEAVKDAFSHAYGGYRKYAWGHDELLPVTCSYSDSRNGWGATIVDALDTMLIMGFEDYYVEALEFVAKIDFAKSSQPAKGFETNIRYLGGLLSANDLRPDPILVQKAVEVTEHVLLPLFNSPTKAPYTDMNLNKGKPINVSTIDLAEFGTYSLEFTRLSQVTNNPKYAQLSNDLIDRAISAPTKFPGLFPTSWTVNPFEPVNSSIITIGGGGDSFYEYLMKNYILLGGSDKRLLDAWTTTVDSIQKYMLSPTEQDSNIQFVSMIQNGEEIYESGELFAKTFMDACEIVWKDTATGIAPESWSWTPQKKFKTRPPNIGVDHSRQHPLPADPTKFAKRKTGEEADRPFDITDSLYDLRPETAESLFYFHRMTGDPRYQEVAWDIFQAIDKYTRTVAGYSSIADVDNRSTKKNNFQESFFLAETLKYLYLIFVDKDCISLDEFVFNTEAHPFKLSKPIKAQNGH